MTGNRWLFHSIFVFVLSVAALAISLFLYIYWYIEVSAGLRSLVERFNIDAEQALAPQTWVVILVLSILVALIVVGIFIIFVYNQKSIQLYRLQRNFISNFTHELKTPVTSLHLYLETFKRHEFPRHEQLAYLDFMLQDVHRLSNTINSILGLAKIEGKNYNKQFAPVDLAGFIDRFKADNAHRFPEADIRVQPPGRAYTYPVNTVFFEMLLMNLLTNAVKYNTAARPVIEIRFRERKRHLEILFADNGVGLRKADRKKVFNKFYQAGRADDRSAKGSGLGLYVVQNIARIHKGKVTAQSEGPGRGTTFVLSLPLKRAIASNRDSHANAICQTHSDH